MNKPLALAAVLLGTTALLGCNSEPENYEDCILKYVKSGMTAGAVRAVAKSCREKFPEVTLSANPQTEALNMPSGVFYYLDSVGTCQEMKISPEGKISSSFCGLGARIENVQSGKEYRLLLSCLDFNRTGKDQVFDVTPAELGLSLSHDQESFFLYSTLAYCLETTQEQRSAIKKAKEEDLRKAEEKRREERKIALIQERRRRATPCCRCLERAVCDEESYPRGRVTRGLSGTFEECLDRILAETAFDDEAFIDNYCASLHCLDVCKPMGFTYRSPWSDQP